MVKSEFEKLKSLKHNESCKLVFKNGLVFDFNDTGRFEPVFNGPTKNQSCPRQQWTCEAEAFDEKTSKNRKCQLVLSEDLDIDFNSISILVFDSMEMCFCPDFTLEIA